MANVAKRLLRLEIALVLVGISLLGLAFATTAHRWSYQKQQARLLFPVIEAGPPASIPVSAEVPAPSPPSPTLPADDRAGSNPLPGRDPLVLGHIAIPRVGVDAMVRTGEDDETLDLAVGHLYDTALPGEGGNVALAGHRDTFFRGLREIRLGDLIQLTIPPAIHEYRVVATKIVAPTDVSVLDSSGTEELTLITCHPFNFIGNAPNRFIVRAVPASALAPAGSAPTRTPSPDPRPPTPVFSTMAGGG